MQTCSSKQRDQFNDHSAFTKPADPFLHGTKIKCSSNKQVSCTRKQPLQCFRTFFLGNQTATRSPYSRVSLRCNTTHHAEDTSAGLFRLLPRTVRPLSPSAPSPSVSSFSPLSQPSNTAPPEGLTLRDRCGEGGESRKSSP